MSNPHLRHDPDNPDQYPWLGRLLLRAAVDQSGDRLFWLLALVCVLLVISGLFFQFKGYFDFESLIGFYGGFGFVVGGLLILMAWVLRRLIRRDEGYYAPGSTNQEPYPWRADQGGQDDDA